jgi:hypothetical protein
VGRFVVHAQVPGSYALRVTRFGYAPLTTGTVELSSGEVMRMTLMMSAAPQRLGTVVVHETRRLNGFELLSDLGFDLRRSKGNGHFLDSTDLSVYKDYPAHLLLVDHPGLGVNFDAPPPPPGSSNPRRRIWDRWNIDSLVMRTGGLATCNPELWIDGFPSWTQALLRTLRASDIHGIEVYSRHQLPSPSIGGALGSFQWVVSTRERCGLIVIWSKRYIGELKRKGHR